MGHDPFFVKHHQRTGKEFHCMLTLCVILPCTCSLYNLTILKVLFQGNNRLEYILYYRNIASCETKECNPTTTLYFAYYALGSETKSRIL